MKRGGKSCQKGSEAVSAMKGGAAIITTDDRISNQPNTDDRYKEVGLIHISESATLSLVGDMMQGISNLFGKSGGIDKVYSDTREKALKKLLDKLSAHQKICNLRMEVSSIHPDQITFNMYGTLMEKKRT